MLRKIFILFFLLTASGIFAAKLNPYLESLKNGKNPVDNRGRTFKTESMSSGIGRGTVRIFGKGDAGQVTMLGGKVESVIGKYFTANIPVSRLSAFADSKDIDFISGGLYMRPYLDKAVPDISANQTYAVGYKGDNVIIGIVDSGIDISHPDFKNENGLSRILYLWDQTVSGTVPPDKFNYGQEWTKDDIDSGRCTEEDYEAHGTHVTGIAAGNGDGSYGKYRGVAPEANIIFVKTTMSLPGILDAVNYIFYKARQLGKPCVINLSLGYQAGDHSADESFNVAMDQIVDFYGKSGHILVWAAGNEAGDPIHTTNLITVTNTAVSVQNDLSTLDMGFYYQSSVNIPVALVHGSTTNIPFTTVNSSSGTANIYFSHYNPNETEVDVELNSSSPTDWKVVFGTNASPLVVDGYMFSDISSSSSGFSNSVTNGTISVSACEKNAIAVAAYVSKTNYTDYLGNPEQSYSPTLGNIAVFSSRGPTRDGQLKPEIAAPGDIVVAPLSSSAHVYSQYVVVKDKYLAMSGTSMAAPVVTGAIALMLEQDPTLTVDQVRDRLKNYATGNAYKTNPGVWDSSFGYGLLNVSGILGESSTNTSLLFTVKNNILKPRADKDNKFSLLVRSVASNKNSLVKVSIYSQNGGAVYRFSDTQISGIEVKDYEWNGKNQSGTSVPAGLYFVLVEADGRSYRYPVLVVE